MSHTPCIIPGDQVYWAVLAVEQTAAAAKAGGTPSCDSAVLDELFAEFVPVPFEGVKAVYATIDRQRVLAAAVSRERLTELVGAETIIVTPDSVPSALAADDHIASLACRLNFLWGDLEPRPVTSAKWRATAFAAAAIVLLGAVAVIGVERRASSMRAAASTHRASMLATLKDLYPRSASAEAGRATLDLDLGRLTRTRAARASVQRDAADAVESLLSVWPRAAAAADAPKLRTESLAATLESLTLAVALEDRGGVAALSDSLRTMPGWRLFQPQFTATTGMNGGGGSANAGMLSLRLAADANGSGDKPGGER